MRLSRFAGSLLVALLLTLTPVHAQQADPPAPIPAPAPPPNPDEARCAARGNVSADTQAAACTNLINNGRHGHASLGTLHLNRGLAYARSGAMDRAIADFDTAI